MSFCLVTLTFDVDCPTIHPFRQLFLVLVVILTILFLSLGGMSDVRSGTLQKFTSGYRGCLRDLVLEDFPSQNVILEAESGQNVVPCY